MLPSPSSDELRAFSLSVFKPVFLLGVSAQLDNNCTVSINYLNAIANGKPEETYIRAVNVFDDIKHRYVHPLPSGSGNATYAAYHSLWARICVLAFYLLQDEPNWKTIILPAMEKLNKSRTFADAMAQGHTLADEFRNMQRVLAAPVGVAQDTISTSSAQDANPISQDPCDAPKPSKIYLKYIILDKDKARSNDEVEDAIHEAVLKGARSAAKCLMKYESLGYITLFGNNMQQIFDTLEEHFVKLRFSYKTFAKYMFK